MSDSDIQKIENELRDLDPDLSEEGSVTHPLSPENQPGEIAVNDGKERHPFRFVALSMGGDNGRTHKVTGRSASLLKEVSLRDLEIMTTKFYEKAFQDATLDKFIHSHEDPHASRFAKWIYQKLSGSNVWDKDRHHREKTPKILAGGHRHVVHDRSSAHVAAWYSSKRPANEVGRHFKLDECRVWMRLHFWALRESGLIEKSPSFADYYLRFIAHFVRVYESTAPYFTRESFRWSADPVNIQNYLNNGRIMKDILGLTMGGAIGQIPDSESQDEAFPYHLYQEESIVLQ